MINEQRLQGHWNQIKGRIHSRWGQLTHDELERFDGNVDRLVGLIERKTGEARESVEQFLSDLADHSSTTVSGGAENVGGYVERAGEKFQDLARQSIESVQQDSDTVCQGYDEMEQLVRRRPSEAAVACFAVGLLTGLAAAFLLHRR